MLTDFPLSCSVKNFFKFFFRRSELIALFALLFVYSTQSAQAQTLNVPATSTSGTYTITWSGVNTTGILDEYISGSWQHVGGGGNSSGSATITKTASGTYTYRLENCTGTPSGLQCTNVPGSKSVLVTLSSSSSSSACSLGTGNTTSYCYDELGRVKSVRHPNGVVNTYNYDAADNRTQKQSTQN